ncbi:MAG TPA: glycine cleavage system protein GcvH [Burkholderiales bacterium]|nr:glycine cleavage system protein GcvH [Burkholderiales bacterium]
MTIPEELKYNETHEWAKLEPDGAVAVGITHFAQDKLGDMVFVEPPKMNSQVKRGDSCAVLESVKAASDLYAPVSGEVIAVNDEVQAAPEKINKDPYGAWLFKLKPDDPSELDSLMSAEQYAALVENEQ